MEGGEDEGGWGALPHVPLLKVLECLGRRDRLAASSTCRQWRRAALQLPLGDKLTLDILKETDIPKTLFLADTFGRKVPEVIITAVVDEGKILGVVGRVLEVLEGNRILRSLKVVPISRSQGGKVSKEVMKSLSKKLKVVLEGRNLLERVGWPGSLAIETLEGSPSKRSRIKSLFLAFVQRQPELSVRADLWMQRLNSFVGLEVLSLNFSVLSDDILRVLGIGSNVGGLKQLNIIALEDNKAISNAGWTAFVLNNEQAKVRFTVAENADVSKLLFPAIPISHFRVLNSCTTRMLDFLVQWNQATLEALEVEDRNDANTDGLDTFIVDPFVLAAWRCHSLHCIRIGYEYGGEELLGIARLKGLSLVRLDIERTNIKFPCRSKLIQLISNALGRSWRPGGGSRKRTIKSNPVDKILRAIGRDEI